MRQHAVEPMTAAAAATWRGLGASAGVVNGRAHVVRAECDVDGVADGSVLVLRHPTPATLPALVTAQAAVCETGGVLNHLAVLARELGKPCVTGIAGLVEAIEPGAWLRVDGAGGTVSLLSGDLRRPPPGLPAGADASMVPVLRFGRFSAAFERVDSSLDLETTVRIAALISVPEAFAAGAPWPFAIEAGTVLVSTGALRRTIDDVLGRIERGALETAALHARYRASCAWPGWAVVARGTPSHDQLREALHRFVHLNQVTWLASAVKDPLVERYRALLRSAPAPFDRAARDSLFLDSLVMPGCSYVERSRGTTAGDAFRRREAAVDGLRRGLSSGDFAGATAYLDALGDLVDLTERKHTDLAGRARGLFGSTANRRVIAALLGLSSGGDAAVQTEAAHRALVEGVLSGLHTRWSVVGDRWESGTEGGNGWTS
jgi:phosphohistidine swiveling domain-containing protein